MSFPMFLPILIPWMKFTPSTGSGFFHQNLGGEACITAGLALKVVSR